MERVRADFPYVRIDRGAYAFDPQGVLRFRADFSAVAPGAALSFVLDVYAADDHSHPGGHAGWWACSLDGARETEVELSAAGGSPAARFAGTEAASFWFNTDFAWTGRALALHLVLREEVSSTIVFEDVLPLHPSQEELDAAPCLSGKGGECRNIPRRGFVQPAGLTLRLVFPSLKRESARLFCAQLLRLLGENGMAVAVYAGEYLPEQRTWMMPTPWLRHTAHARDLVFCVYDGADPYLPLVAELACRKVLYCLHRQDWQRFQAFDAELARHLRRGLADLAWVPAFDGLCGERDEAVREVWDNLTALLRAENPKDLLPPDGRKTLTTREIMAGGLALRGMAHDQGWLDLCRDDRAALESLVPHLECFPPLLWKEPEPENGEECEVPPRFLLCVGGFRPDRHYERVLDIFAALAEEEAELGLVLAGRISVRGYWEYLCFLRAHTHARFSDRILLLPDCPEERLRWLYRRATLFLSASGYSGHSASLKRALDAGLPVIARRDGGPDGAMAGLRFTADSADEDVAVDALRLLRDEALRQRVIAEQRENLRRRKKDAPARAFWRVLENALNVREHPRSPETDKERGRG